MKKILGVALLAAVFSCPVPSFAACDEAEAQDIISQLINSGLASRTQEFVTVRYRWRGNWNALTEQQKYNFAAGIGEAERCLHGDVTVRIHHAGREVAKSSPFETTVR